MYQLIPFTLKMVVLIQYVLLDIAKSNESILITHVKQLIDENSI